ncbi:MAG: hypothetical protein HKN16_00995, partial [Saprospiraceae bacterium]|nr:hypothetical protein [Saprospiraceae bacterium]
MKKLKLFFSAVAMMLFVGLQAQVLQPTSLSTTLTAGTDFADGDNYYDSGGAAGTYSASESGSLDLCANAGEEVVITFTEFDLETGSGGQCWDYLTITGDTGGNDGVWTGDTFDVSDTGDPFVPPCSNDATDAADAVVIPPMTSSDGGCLTFAFTSDSGFQQGGWAATINVNSLAPPPPPGGDPCTLTCPPNITVNLDPGACDAVVNYNVTVSGDCPDPDVAFADQGWVEADDGGGGSITMDASGFTQVSGDAGTGSMTSATFTAPGDGTLSFD